MYILAVGNVSEGEVRSCSTHQELNYEPLKAAKERTTASYHKVNRATAVINGSVVVIACVHSGLVEFKYHI